MKIRIFELLMIFLVILVFSSQFPLFASQELGAPFIKNYYPKEYQGSPQNWAIVQDHRGVMYFGNTDGFLLEFDGQYWNKGIHIPNNSSVRSLDIDKNGTIYVGAVNEFGYIKTNKKGQMIYCSLSKKLNEKEKVFGDVWRLYATRHGVYFLTKLVIYRYFKGKIEVINLSQSLVSSSAKIKNDIFCISKKGIHIIRNGKLYLLPHTKFLSIKKNYSQMLPYPENKILIVSEKLGCYVYDLALLSKNGFFQKDVSPNHVPDNLINRLPTEIDEYIKANRNYCGAFLKGYNYAIGTISGGIIMMDQFGKLVRIINKHRGLPDRFIFYLYPDNSGNLWAASNGSISYVETASPISSFKASSGLKEWVLSLTRYNNRLYVGDFKGVYYLEDYSPQLKNDQHRFIPMNIEGVCHEFMKFKDIMLVGGQFGVVGIRSDDIFQKLYFKQIVNCLGQSKRFPNHVFVGLAAPEGLKAIKTKFTSESTPTLEHMPVKFSEIKFEIKDIVDDSSGNLWLATFYNGIIYIRFTGNDMAHYKIFHYTTKHGLPMNNLIMIQIKDDYLILATQKGIYQSTLPVNTAFDPKKLRFIKEHTYGKWFNDRSQEVNEVNFNINNQIWMNARSRYFTQTLVNNHSYLVNELPLQKTKVSSFNDILQEKNGIVWICSNVGLYRYDLTLKKDYKPQYHALIRKVTVGKNRVIFYGNDRLSQPPILKYKDNRIIFEYSAPFYEFPQDTRFSYMLDGMDEEWSDWTRDSKKEYTNVSEGHYYFKVKAKNIFHHESQIGTYEFKIRPPWWRTIAAYLGYLGILIFIVFIGIRINTRRLLIAKKKLEQIVKEKTAEVVQQKDEIIQQRDKIESYASELYTTNQHLEESRNALWGEMELAKKIQTVLLPQKPEIPGFEIAAYMKPADKVGGDYFDVINVKEKDWIVIGDVSGHGVTAGLIMMMVQTSIHSVLDKSNNDSPKKILESVNRVIYKNIRKLGEDKYMTITLFSCIENGQLFFSGLHQDIMIYRNDKDEVERVETNGMWIGMIDEIGDMLEVNQLGLNPNDIMFLYTDGITEAKNNKGNMYSDEKLAEVFKKLGHLSPEKIRDGILNSLKEYCCHDDVTMMIVKRIP